MNLTDAQVVGALFIVVGTAVFIGVGALYVMALGSARWAQVEGRMLSAEYVSGADSSSSSQRPYWVHLKVRYEYEVGGRAFTGNRVIFGESMWRGKWAPKREDRQVPYTPDQTVTVYYDPARPHRSTLSRTVMDFQFRSVLVVAAVFVLAGIGALTGHITVQN